jgi:hypothetical protein
MRPDGQTQLQQQALLSGVQATGTQTTELPQTISTGN